MDEVLQNALELLARIIVNADCVPDREAMEKAIGDDGRTTQGGLAFACDALRKAASGQQKNLPEICAEVEVG